jgi:hypothetical protein
MAEQDVHREGQPPTIPPPPSIRRGKQLFSYLVIILGGAICSAMFTAMLFWVGDWVADRENRPGEVLLVTAVMGFAGAVLGSMLTSRAICYSMVVGSILGALVTLPGRRPKFHESFIDLGTLTLGMLIGLFIGCCLTLKNRPRITPEA